MARAAATTPMKQAAARQMRRTAELLDADHPETIAGDHLRDAAKVLEHGSLEGAKRHLDAAMEVLTPRNLIRHGITDDEGHATAKHHMHQVHRHRLAVQDIEDTSGRNDRLRAMARAARGQPEPREPFQPAEPVAASRPAGKVTDLAAWETERRGRGGQWVAGAMDAIMSHPQLSAMDPQDRQVVLGHLKQAAFASDHTTAEMHLTDARRRATKAGAGDLVKQISQVHAYHRLAATRAAGIKPRMSQASFNRFIKGEQARPRPVPRVVPGRGYQPPFALATELSARTAMLERTPAPRGRPGGPGLYDVSGMGHTAYLQQIVKALIEKRGMTPGKAYAIARGAIRKWMRGGGHVHPEVQAAAGRAEAGELARQARAKASHGHANGWDVADALIELACRPPSVIELFNPYHGTGGKFTTASGASSGQGKAQGGGKGSRAQQRAQLTRQISSLRSRIAGLEGQLRNARAGAGRSRSSTPAKRGAGATSARAAKAGKTASGKGASTSSTASSRYRSPSAIRAQIRILRAQLRADQMKLKALK